MRNQGKGLASTKDQCSRSRVPYHWSNPKGHTCHRSNTRRHPKGRPATTTHSQGGNFFTSCHPKEEEEKEEEVVEVSDSEDEFNIFNQILSLKASPGDLDSPSFLAQSSPHQEAVDTSSDMGIQRKQRSTLQKLLESEFGGKAAQTKLPTPPPSPPTRADSANHKKKRDQKGKKVMETGRNQPF